MANAYFERCMKVGPKGSDPLCKGTCIFGIAAYETQFARTIAQVKIIFSRILEEPIEITPHQIQYQCPNEISELALKEADLMGPDEHLVRGDLTVTI